jgi:hypothetical protein
MNYIRLGNDTTSTFTSSNAAKAASPPSGGFVGSAIGFAIPVVTGQPIALKFTTQASGAVARGGAFLVFED